jgi:hypothetical protein
MHEVYSMNLPRYTLQNKMEVCLGIKANFKKEAFANSSILFIPILHNQEIL